MALSPDTTSTSSKNVLASDVDIKGTIKFDTELIFDGKLEGEIFSEDGNLTLGKNADVHGELKTKSSSCMAASMETSPSLSAQSSNQLPSLPEISKRCALSSRKVQFSLENRRSLRSQVRNVPESPRTTTKLARFSPLLLLHSS